MSETDRYTIEILDVTLNAIEAMASSEKESHSPSALARHLKINRSRLFRILKTLERRGYVDFDPQTETYRLGLKFLTLSQHISERINLRREAEDLLKKLANDTGDSVHLVCRSRNSAIVVDRYLGDNMLQAGTPIGEQLPLYTGAVPKLLLAILPEEERERILSKMDLAPFTPNTITDKNHLRRVLAAIRQNGYSVDDEELEIGVYAFGAPVYDDMGYPLAGISVTTPVVRYDLERRFELIRMVVATARELSCRLGYRPKQGMETTNLFTPPSQDGKNPSKTT